MGLLAALGDSGHPFAKVETRRVEIDKDTETMAVTYTLDPGPVMHFGPVAIEGLERLDPAYVEGRLRWQRGEVYDASPSGRISAAPIFWPSTRISSRPPRSAKTRRLPRSDPARPRNHPAHRTPDTRIRVHDRVFRMMFKILPDRPVDWQDVWLGAAVTAGLFTVGKYLISLYIGSINIASRR
jgi:hypothetical protein